MAQIKEKKKICIIGAGVSGITAAKACQEENLDYVIYEMYHSFGGLWRYRDEIVEGMGCVSAGTIVNSSKEMIAFSDFPPNASLPNYMHHTNLIKYLEDYAKHVNCLDRIKFQHKVLNIAKSHDFDATGRWMVDIQNITTDSTFTEMFDGIMVCTGHHTKPSMAHFPGQELFKGQIIHSHSYRKPMEFYGKRVVVVGIGNSGADVAAELSTINDKVYLSTRTGAWIFGRMGANGRPSDMIATRRYINWLVGIMPYRMLCSMAEKALDKKFNHSFYKIKPKHRVFEQTVTINDYLPVRILSGTIELKNNIERLTETGVIFEGETEEVACDVLILATGYKLNFPFISQSLVPVKDNKVDLYKCMFSPSLGHTLAFICLVQSNGPLWPIAELQSRWFAQCMAGHTKLPCVEKMEKDIIKQRKYLESRFYTSERHTIMIDWINYSDELSEYVGCNLKLRKYFLKDFKLWKKLIFGTSFSYQYRLNGPHKWAGAREAILNATDRVEAPFRSRKLTDENGKMESESKTKRKVKSDNSKVENGSHDVKKVD